MLCETLYKVMLAKFPVFNRIHGLTKYVDFT